jgi:uncharacterized glyoxalase superfamily protein PhnB
MVSAVSDAPASTVWHSFRCRDSRAQIEFLTKALGFVVAVLYEEDGAVGHAQLDWPEGGGVMLGDERPGDAVSQPPGAAAAYVVTAEPDAIHERAVAAGAEIVRPLGEQEYGTRDFTVRDPEGNIWSFGTYPGAARRED